MYCTRRYSSSSGLLYSSSSIIRVVVVVVVDVQQTAASSLHYYHTRITVVQRVFHTKRAFSYAFNNIRCVVRRELFPARCTLSAPARIRHYSAIIFHVRRENWTTFFFRTRSLLVFNDTHYCFLYWLTISNDPARVDRKGSKTWTLVTCVAWRITCFSRSRLRKAGPVAASRGAHFLLSGRACVGHLPINSSITLPYHTSQR